VRPQELAAAFSQLTGDASSQIAADIMLLLAPVALLLALVKAATNWNDRDYKSGTTLLLSLLAMAIFPPVIGFAVYFCLVHSPKQFAQSKSELQQQQRLMARATARAPAMALWMVWPISALAMVIAAGIFYTEIRIDVASAALASVFMTLSMLTVPHMAMPMLVEAAIAKPRP
jgi:Brp/Blh family beta-carotene 15,15'-monooxygenase